MHQDYSQQSGHKVLGWKTEVSNNQTVIHDDYFIPNRVAYLNNYYMYENIWYININETNLKNYFISSGQTCLELKKSNMRSPYILQQVFSFCQCHFMRLTEIFCQLLCSKSWKNETCFLFSYNWCDIIINIQKVKLRLVSCPSIYSLGLKPCMGSASDTCGK